MFESLGAVMREDSIPSEHATSSSTISVYLERKYVPREEMNSHVAKTPFGLTISVDDPNV